MKKKNNKFKDLLSNQKGIALLTVLIFIFLMVTFVVALLAMTGNDIKISAIQRDSTEAFYQAESGIEQALYNLNMDDDYDIIHWRPNSSDPYIKEPFNSSEYYEVTITDIGDPPELPTDKISIISTGILTPVGVENSRKRSVEVIAEIGWNTDVTYKYALLSEKVVLINGSGPDCPRINGDIHSNDAIEVHSQNFDEFYTGTATASGETNDLDETEEQIYTGPLNAPIVDIPPVNYDVLKSRALAAESTTGVTHYHTGNVILGNSEVRNWTGIHYIEGNLEAKNGSEIHVEDGAIIATGDVNVKEGAIFEINNDPINYLDPTDPITALALVAQGDIRIFAKSTIATGVVQSILPDGTCEGYIELKNGCTVTGSVIADTIFLHNGAVINYDETNLQKFVNQGDPFYKKISWREI